MKQNIAPLIASIILLSSCTMIPAQKIPELPVAEQFPSNIKESQSESETIQNWRGFFKDEHLQEIIATALENNRDLKIAALNVQAAKALYGIQRSELFPSIDLEASSTKTRFTEAQGNSLNSTTSRYSANVATTNFEIDLFGKIRSKNQAALEDFLSIKSNQDAVKISLISETANAYLQLLADQKILDVTNKTLVSQIKSNKLITSSYNNGVASKLELAQASQVLEEVKAGKALYERKVTEDKNALMLLIGTKEDTILDKISSLDKLTLITQVPNNLSSKTLLTRPDINKAEHELKSANADIGAARAAFFPSISLTGTFGLASSDLSDLFTSAATGAWSFTPKVSLPIFQGGYNIANLKYTKAQKEIAVNQYEKTIQSAFREVYNYLAANGTLKAELDATKLQVQSAKTVADLSKARYQSGIDSLLNSLNAERSFFAAQKQEAEIQKLILANQVNLYKALGGGVD